MKSVIAHSRGVLMISLYSVEVMPLKNSEDGSIAEATEKGLLRLKTILPLSSPVRLMVAKRPVPPAPVSGAPGL